MADTPCPVAVLLKAADIMESGGMQRGNRGKTLSTDGPHCALGAVDAAAYLNRADMRCRIGAQDLLANLLRPLIPVDAFDKYNDPDHFAIPDHRSRTSVIATWNNMVAVDAAEVAAAMRKAAGAKD